MDSTVNSPGFLQINGIYPLGGLAKNAHMDYYRY